ncbi:S-adenosyl-L-methionine-dependent methyltransferase [Pseudoneurospora amorphoporcata]|uniref:S-adenosyl-L-methionine-dependent methyltransferase n=1 Tax=Pseudoneurospora amorphoporcata TaxID=241081 RepID=A0AAN6NK38_9PEZI|nr:S-adenosyl-L-methionine-dependent methyltransferase [Pseudoneurospora amorphoporcata]
MSSQQNQGPTPPARGEEPAFNLTPLSNNDLFTTLCPSYEVAFANIPARDNSLSWLLAKLADRDTFPPHPRPWIHDALPLRLQRKHILDIGSGTGRPVCSALAEAGHSVLGIDLCPAIVEFAKQNVAALYPDGRAEFAEADVRKFEPERDDPFFKAQTEVLRAKRETWEEGDPEGYHAVTAYFSLLAGFETQKEIKKVIKKVCYWLREGGLFVLGTLPMDVEGEVIGWMGKPVTVSSLSRSKVLEAVREVGFQVDWEATRKFVPKAVEAGILKPEEVKKA